MSLGHNLRPWRVRGACADSDSSFRPVFPRELGMIRRLACGLDYLSSVSVRIRRCVEDLLGGWLHVGHEWRNHLIYLRYLIGDEGRVLARVLVVVAKLDCHLEGKEQCVHLIGSCETVVRRFEVQRGGVHIPTKITKDPQ